LKSGLGPGVRDGRTDGLGKNADVVAVVGSEIGKLYRCLRALSGQKVAKSVQWSMTHAAQHVRLPIRLKVHSLLPSPSGDRPAPRDMVSCISSSGMKPHGLLEDCTTALNA
jgi:hypothetical protein